MSGKDLKKLDIRKLFLSKWLYYSTIAVALLILFFYFLPLAWKGDAIAANFLSEIWGLFFTLAIFVMILDFREWLEWKRVEDRVMKKIGDMLPSMVFDFAVIVEDKRSILSPSRLSKSGKVFDLYLRRMHSPLAREIKFTEQAKKDLLDEEKHREYEKMVSFNLERLSRIEEKYSKFLDSELRASLMDIQDRLEELRLLFRFVAKSEKDFEKMIYLIKKVMSEVLKLKEKGFWIVTIGEKVLDFDYYDRKKK